MALCTVCEVHTESTFRVEGMDCREEVALIERRFTDLAGIETFSADVINRKLHVTHDAAKLSAPAIAAAVADAGMRAWLEHDTTPAGPLAAASRIWPLAAASILLSTALGLQWRSASTGPVVLLSLAAMGFAIPLTAQKAWRAIKLRALDINVLMVVAVVGAAVLGEWTEAASVVVLFALAQLLETRTLERARRAVSALLDLAPAQVLVKDEGGERRVAAAAVTPGTVIVVKPGEQLALDGEVVAGHSAVNQAPVTGESMPVEKGVGDTIYAGSINGPGALDVRVTRRRDDSTLARIIHMVERAQAQRAPAQHFVDRFAAVYTPVVLVLALVVAVVPPLLMDGGWSTWIYRALVLLVVSCPCALVISTPVSIVAALAAAARHGVLVKGGAHLERAGEVQCVAFDKTGTLTEGRPDVVSVQPLAGAQRGDVLTLAAAVEHRSTHPIARAIVRQAVHEGVGQARAEGAAALVGGAEGQVAGEAIVVGNHRLFEERGLCTEEMHERLAETAGTGRTPVLVARGGKPIGVVAIADRPRPEAREAVAALRRRGVKSVVMLTGDSADAARTVASEVGVDQCHAELTPEGKAHLLEGLKRRHGTVAMIGDGINDAPALATADVGIAMGAMGSDAAIESADVALMSDELMKVPFIIRLSRTTVRNIQWNLAISLALKAAFLIATVAGAATLWMAILADTGATILVVANALRLLRAD